MYEMGTRSGRQGGSPLRYQGRATCRHRLACGCTLVWLLVGLDARAQSTEPTQSPAAPAPAAPPAIAPPSQTSTSAAPTDDDAAWDRQYAAAREQLLAGFFEDAAERFDGLMARARDADHRALAETLRDIARSYGSRGLALVRRSDLGESNLSARSVNERTTDEIAVLYLNTLTYGIGTGLWFDAHTQPSTNAGVVLPMLLATGISAGTVALLDIGHPLRYGVPQSAVSGLYLGLEEGLLLSLWNQAANAASPWSGTTVADVIWATSTAGIVGGAVIGTTAGATPGRASFVGTTGFWTGAVIGLTAIAIGGTSDSAAGALLAADVGLNVGIVGGLVGANIVSPSIARVRFLDLGGLAGGLLFGGVTLAADNASDNGRAICGMTALGAAVGLGIAGWATRNMPADRPEDRTSRTGPRLDPALVPVRGGATFGVQATL